MELIGKLYDIESKRLAWAMLSAGGIRYTTAGPHLPHSTDQPIDVGGNGVNEVEQFIWQLDGS